MADRSIAARADFDIIRYAQVWEDADILLDGLRVQPGEVVYSIASAGDNALALLTCDPGRLVAFDLSESQLACLRLRIAAYRALDHQGLLELMGSRPSSRRAALLEKAARTLSGPDRAFWVRHRPQIEAYGLGGIGKFERYFRIFRQRVLPRVHGRRTLAGLMQERSAGERARFFERSWNTWRWRGLLGLFFSRWVMGRLGRDPSFFAFAEGSLGDQVAAKARQAVTEQDPTANPYLHWILFGTHGDALPLALRPEHFETIRARLERIEIRHVAIEELAMERARGHAFNLSDIFEYMPPGHFADVVARVLDMAEPGARVLYWNMMVPRAIPESCRPRMQRNAALEAALKPRDKAFFYRDLIIGEVIG
jgi:S-adenosylmethionine:diacylglycerol 3-amino-3-carboxypropyl transferase